jgi:hypothetical protein
MSSIIIQKEMTAMRCVCGYFWYTGSKSRYPSCPRCNSQISRRLREVQVKVKNEVPELGQDSTQVQGAGLPNHPMREQKGK